MSAKLGIKAHQYWCFIIYKKNCFWLSVLLIENVHNPLWLICFDPSHVHSRSCCLSSTESENEWIYSRRLHPSLLLCRSIFQLQLCFVVPLFFSFFFFWELRCFFAIKAQRNQSVSVSLEQERKAKVYESGAAGATTNGLVMHLLYDNRVAGNTLLGSALLRRSTIRYEASLLQSTTKGAVWFHSAQTTESQVHSVTFLPLLEDATLLMEHTNKLLTHHVWPRVQNKL